MKMNLAVTAMMAAVICVLAPFSIPIGPVPVSLTSLVIYFYIFCFWVEDDGGELSGVRSDWGGGAACFFPVLPADLGN